MRKILLVLSSIVLTSVLSAQDIKISVAPTVNNAFYFQVVNGGSSHIPKPGISTSIGYYIRQDNKISYSAGLSYHFTQVKVDPMFNGVNDPLPFSESFNIISFDIGAVYNLKKDFYISFGPTIDLQLNHKNEKSIDDQTGLGISFGTGRNISLNDHFRLSIEPALRIHNIIPFSDENLPLRTTVAGINLGLIL